MKRPQPIATAEQTVSIAALGLANDPAAVLTAALGKVLHNVIERGADPLTVGVQLIGTPAGVTAQARGRVKG